MEVTSLQSSITSWEPEQSSSAFCPMILKGYETHPPKWFLFFCPLGGIRAKTSLTWPPLSAGNLPGVMGSREATCCHGHGHRSSLQTCFQQGKLLALDHGPQAKFEPPSVFAQPGSKNGFYVIF